MHIRVFYGNCEVYTTDTRLTESERFIRIFHGSHLGESRPYELPLLSKIYGPPTARQIELPVVNNYSKETIKVMDFLKRGILLEINEAHDMFVTRLCITRVRQMLYFFFFLVQNSCPQLQFLPVSLDWEGVYSQKKIRSVGAVPHASQNPYTIYDLNLRFFLPYL